MHLEHDARLVQAPGSRQTLHVEVAVGPLAVDFAATAVEGLDAGFGEGRKHPVAVDAGLKPLWPHVSVDLVEGVTDAVGRQRHADGRKRLQGVDPDAGVARALLEPASELAELDAADGRLQLEHAPVCAEALMHPAEVLAADGGGLHHQVMALAVVLEGPRALPLILVSDQQCPALAGGRHDLVLAERVGRHVAEGARGLATNRRAYRLRAVLGDPQLVLFGQRHDTRHVAWPAGEMHWNDALGARADQWRDGLRGDVAACLVHVGEDGRRARQADAGGRRDEAPRRDDHLVARSSAQNLQREVQRHRTVGERDRVWHAGEPRKLALEVEDVLRPPLAGPLVDVPRAQDRRDGLDLVVVEARPGLGFELGWGHVLQVLSLPMRWQCLGLESSSKTISTRPPIQPVNRAMRGSGVCWRARPSGSPPSRR